MEFTDKNFLFKIAFLLCGILIAACGNASKNTNNTPQNLKSMIHPNKLNIKIPENFSARQTENGFVIEPSGEENLNLRNPVLIYVSLSKENVLADSADVKTKNIGGKSVNYSLEKSDGGSGGETYSLQITEKTSLGYIQYGQALQSEFSEPDFETLWTIAENTSIEK